MSQNAALDAGLDDLCFVETVNGVFLLTSSGRGGGLASYRLTSGGTWQALDQAFFSGPTSLGSLDVLGLVQTALGLVVTVSSDTGGMSGFALRNDGTFAGQSRLNALETAGLLLGGAVDGAALTLLQRAGLCESFLPAGIGAGYGQIVTSSQVNDCRFLLLADQTANELSVLMLGGITDRAHLATRMGADQGLGIAVPTALQTVEVAGQSFVLLGAAGSSSLSVLQLTETGNLILTDHLIDTLETRFGGVQAIATAQVGHHVLVLVGGGDDGISLFSMLPDGRLLWRDTVADSVQTGLNNVSSLAMHIIGSTVHVSVGSQNEAGVSLFSLSAPTVGEYWSNGTATAQNRLGTLRDDILMAGVDGDTLRGAEGADILVAGPGRTTLTGGSGADIFVLRASSTNARITDFEVGVDRLDLSDWPMLRDPLALGMASTSTGMILSYRDYRLEIVTSTQTPLVATSLFGGRFQWADRIFVPIDPAVHDAEAGMLLRADDVGASLFGSAWEDRLYGGAGADVLTGGGGNDQLSGGDGDDTLYGGEGNDTLYGNAGDDLLEVTSGANMLSGGTGNDTIYGGAESDTLLGGDGNDRLIGREGNDSLRGDSGNDTLYGLDGNDILRGDSGINYLSGGNGNDSLYGGTGVDTLFGGAGNDSLVGGAGHDSLRGNSGNDRLYGLDGNDILRGDSGTNYLSGGNGNDRLYGGTGVDTLFGGAGNDRLVGGAGHDSLRGNSGNDRLYGLDGNDILRGDSGINYLSGGNGNDTIYGGTGVDTIYGGAGHDSLVGGAGNDSLRGNSGNDRLYGLDGNDILRGDSGTNYLSGGNGDDRLYGDSGVDTLFGGAGHDRLVGAGGNDSLRGNGGNDTLYGNGGNDILRGDSGTNYLSGGTGDDTLYGGTGVDTLFGGAGNDRLVGGTGDDSLRGNSGNDSLYGLDGNDILRGDSGTNYLSGGNGNDSLYGGTGLDTLYGGAGNDLMTGGTGNDRLYGDEGDDQLYGNDGADWLLGGDGNDALLGGLGNDTLIGGAGRDTLDGGAGADVFVWLTAADSPNSSSRDQLRDFETGVDRIDLSQLHPDLHWVYQLTGTAGDVFYNAAIGRVLVDLNGSGTADFSIDITGAPLLSEADFFFG
ncbi:calcium-binding protein [Pseudorhodobacter sp. E13]|uniref:calcium-binding protein n=1 Tax=Pseudorhodobacter sp. E13 TaxID=2487931 RepID=UPI00131550DD|nr:calcium-binding protein [Pseudorhodobacter sp. E13]